MSWLAVLEAATWRGVCAVSRQRHEAPGEDPELHFLDTGLACYLLESGRRRSSPTPLRGAIFETWWRPNPEGPRASGSRPSLSFYRMQGSGGDWSWIWRVPPRRRDEVAKTVASDFSPAQGVRVRPRILAPESFRPPFVVYAGASDNAVDGPGNPWSAVTAWSGGTGTSRTPRCRDPDGQCRRWRWAGRPPGASGGAPRWAGWLA